MRTGIDATSEPRALTEGAALLRRFDAATIDQRLRVPMIMATLLVIPDLILEGRPPRGSWHTPAVIGDWLIWLVFLGEFAAIMLFARDWRWWLRSYPLAPALIVLTPPFAPAGLQALRLFRLLRLLRVGRGFQVLTSLLTMEGLKYVLALALFLIVGGGTVFAEVESGVGHPVSTWDGIWWAIGTMSTEGSNISATTTTGRIIAIVLMLTGIGTFSVLTGALAQKFLTNSRSPTPSISEELMRLAQLRDQGILTDDEFAGQKAKLLG